MNPPFGELSESVKKYLEGAYPNSKTNLLTIFVERGTLYLRNEGGWAITSRTSFFLSSYKKWRKNVLLANTRLCEFIDLGEGVLDDANVEVAAYCLEVNR
jgi:hypothetical protein